MDYGKEQKFDLDQYNLDTDEWDYSPERNNRAIGNKVISTPETSSPASVPEAAANSAEFPQGEAFMPPADPLASPPAAEPAALDPQIFASPTPNPSEDDPSTIKTDDSLSPEGERALKKLTHALETDKISPEDFYESSRDLVDLNLGNSYADREASRQRVQGAGK